VPVFNFVRRSYYQDSVTLMTLSSEMEAAPGVSRAAAMMGTPPNLALLRDAGLLAAEGEGAGAGDLVVAVLAATPEAAEAARAAALRALAARRAVPAGAAARPRTLAAARRALPDANLVLISVPGLYAGAEAFRALRAGLHVMLFSDNVPVDTELALKRAALERGLWLLGPDCGTAVIHGVPLGFANAVPRGRVGLVGASGTGLQEVCCAIAALGEGVSHAVGVGGRDLSDAVGGLMTRRALEALAADPATEVLVVVGKRPSPAMAGRLAQDARRLDKPCVLGFVGGTAGLDGGDRLHVAGTLEDAARAAVALARGEVPAAVDFTRPPDEIERLVALATAGLGPSQRYVRGVFSGGTLAWEARHLLARRLPGVTEGVTGGGAGHRVTDLGEDVFTVGRPHPMLDGTVRRQWIAREGDDPGTAVLLLDVVLGWGAHPDPVGEILPAIEATRARARDAGRGLAIVASVTGTDRDPQRRTAQAAALAAHGVVVMDSNAQAARLAARVAAGRSAA